MALYIYCNDQNVRLVRKDTYTGMKKEITNIQVVKSRRQVDISRITF